VPGHEGVGIVERVRPAVTGHATGDRVAIPWLGHACGTCDYCITGWETLCEAQLNTGYAIAAHVVNAATTDPVTAIEALGGADVAVVLGLDFPLAGTPAPDAELLERVRGQFAARGLTVY
jgi:propanol-preferring alcohol dehydrogenase